MTHDDVTQFLSDAASHVSRTGRTVLLHEDSMGDRLTLRDSAGLGEFDISAKDFTESLESSTRECESVVRAGGLGKIVECVNHGHGPMQWSSCATCRRKLELS